ncbi:MAG: hypothetical protein WCR36_07610 [Bacteroidaceae bacterium]
MNDNLRKIFNYPTDTPLKFWLKYWKSYIKELCDLDNYGTQLDNPHFILNDIVTEIKYNSFQNSDNRKLFKEMLGKCLKSNEVFSNLYHTQCALAFKNWDTSPLYVDSICKNILQSMDKYDYLNVIAKKLKQSIDKNDNLSKEIKSAICLYTDLFITEFICFGIDINDIKDFINEDDVCIVEGGEVLCAPETFYELNQTNFKTKELYYEAVSQRLQERNAEDYIDNIMKHFHKQPKDGHVILRLLGIKGSIDSYIQGVHIYSVDKTTSLKATHLSKIEEPDDSFQFVNIAVPISHRFFHTSVNIAKEKANSILDFLSLNIDQKQELSVSKQFAAIEIDGEECGSMESFKDNIERARFYRDVESYNLSNIADKLPDFLKEFNNPKNIDDETFRKIANAMHWYKKAVYSDRYEDKLLYSWIAIESILKVRDHIKTNIITQEKERNILNLTKLLCSCIMTHNRFYSYGRNTYVDLIQETQQNDNFYDFSSKVIENAKLNLQPGDKIKLADFFNNLSSIIEEINDEVYKCELIRLQFFYKDENGIKDFKNMVCNDITLIYRLRNLIAHNAVYPQYQTKLYAYKAQFICASLIQAVRHHCNKYGLDIGNALLRIYTDCSLFEYNIDNHIKSIKEPCHD